MEKYYIYVITNKINNRKYIGITNTSIKRRFNEHLRKSRFGSSSNLHKAIRKYGEQNFYIKEIENFETNDKKYAYSVEQNYINRYQKEWNLYNMELHFGWNIYDRKGINNPMYGKISGNAKKVVIFDTEYNSLTEAEKILNINRNTLRRYCLKDEKEDCYYLS